VGRAKSNVILNSARNIPEIYGLEDEKPEIVILMLRNGRSLILFVSRTRHNISSMHNSEM
jgi:hypothetical protein